MGGIVRPLEEVMEVIQTLAESDSVDPVRGTLPDFHSWNTFRKANGSDVAPSMNSIDL